nr:immunoglobulin heavy chain junction region [Macaca mulatta]
YVRDFYGSGLDVW